LRSARRSGFRWLLAVLKPDTRAPSRAVEEFPAIRDFSEILPN
jgi:putative hydrolase of the HAD superfamily